MHSSTRPALAVLALALVFTVLPVASHPTGTFADAQVCPEPTLSPDDPRAQWVEGTMADDDGATRDYYNRAARLAWERPFGDIVDVNGWPVLGIPYAHSILEDDNTPGPQTWDVTSLVAEWLTGTPNQGLSLQRMAGHGPFDFYSREHSVAAERPRLTVTTSSGTYVLEPEADTRIDTSTYQGFGDDTSLRVANGEHHSLLRFDLSGIPADAILNTATLQLWSYAEYGGSPFEVGVFRIFHDPGSLPPAQNGLAYSYAGDNGVASHPDVHEHTTFTNAAWSDVYANADSPNLQLVSSAPGFKPLDGSALKITVPQGENTGAGFAFKFEDQTGAEPEEIYFRYYIRIDQSWDPSDGGKFPGISGTYGVAGWGGRPANGTNGWSARGLYQPSVVGSDNPLYGTVPVGHYVYHAEQSSQWGDNVLWQDAYLGYLEKDRWYSIEQHLVMNTPGVNDGVLETWVDGRLAYRKTDWRWRDTSDLKIEQIWLNVYHGGSDVPDQDISLYIDNIVIADSYIGPMKGAPCAPSSGTFIDDDDSIFEGDIEWLAAAGITRGCNPNEGNTRFCPDEPVTRGQMAAFLVRAMGYSDDGGGNLFADDNGSIFEADIDKLATAGVTRGCNPAEGNTRYCPNDYVTRGQMAAFLVRAMGYTDDGGGNLFTDDNGSIFEADINRLATAGVTRGCNPAEGNTNYCPNSYVTRGQMAAFLRRALEP